MERIIYNPYTFLLEKHRFVYMQGGIFFEKERIENMADERDNAIFILGMEGSGAMYER